MKTPTLAISGVTTKAELVDSVMEYLKDPVKVTQGLDFSIAKTGLHSMTVEQLRALERLLYWKSNREGGQR